MDGRDKRGHEVDFILAPTKQSSLTIECKWSASDFDSANLRAFRRPYPRGDNLVVANDVERSFTRSYDGLSVRFVSLSDLIAEVTRNNDRVHNHKTVTVGPTHE